MARQRRTVRHVAKGSAVDIKIWRSTSLGYGYRSSPTSEPEPHSAKLNLPVTSACPQILRTAIPSLQPPRTHLELIPPPPRDTEALNRSLRRCSAHALRRSCTRVTSTHVCRLPSLAISSRAFSPHRSNMAIPGCPRTKGAALFINRSPARRLRP